MASYQQKGSCSHVPLWGGSSREQIVLISLIFKAAMKRKRTTLSFELPEEAKFPLLEKASPEVVAALLQGCETLLQTSNAVDLPLQLKAARAAGFEDGVKSAEVLVRSQEGIRGQLTSLSENFQRVFRDGGNQAKGKGGESTIQSYIKELLPQAEVTVVSSKPESTDLLVTVEGVRIAIEVKNKKTVGKGDREKFERDVTTNKEKAAAFILVSCMEDVPIALRGSLVQRAAVGVLPVVYLSRAFADQGFALVVCLTMLAAELAESKAPEQALPTVHHITKKLGADMADCAQRLTHAKEMTDNALTSLQIATLRYQEVVKIMETMLPAQPRDTRAKTTLPESPLPSL